MLENFTEISWEYLKVFSFKRCQTSDIDFVVYGCSDIIKLEEDLTEIDTLRKIDIFDYDSIHNPFLLEDIEKYGKQIY